MTQDVHKLLSDLFDKAEELHLEEEHRSADRFFFMRPSGFPYCGLRKLLTAPTFFEDSATSTLASSYFTGVGTATHSIFQKFLGRMGTIVGDWRCPKCKDVKRFSTYSACTDCQKPRVYDELELVYQNIVVGHTDCLFKISGKKEKGKPRYYVVDYKTSAYYKTKDKKRAKNIFPLRSNVQQIEMYVVLLEDCFGIEIEGYSLAYLGRDLPLGKSGRHLVVVKMTDKQKLKCRKKLKRWIKCHRKVLTARKPEDVEYLKENKLCASMQDYKDNYHEYEGCNISPYCFNEKKLDDLIKRRMKLQWYPLIRQAPERIKKVLEKDQT